MGAATAAGGKSVSMADVKEELEGLMKGIEAHISSLKFGEVSFVVKFQHGAPTMTELNMKRQRKTGARE